MKQSSKFTKRSQKHSPKNQRKTHPWATGSTAFPEHHCWQPVFRPEFRQRRFPHRRRARHQIQWCAFTFRSRNLQHVLPGQACCREHLLFNFPRITSRYLFTSVKLIREYVLIIIQKLLYRDMLLIIWVFVNTRILSADRFDDSICSFPRSSFFHYKTILSWFQ